MVLFEAIGGYTNNLHITLLEIRSATSDLSKFGGADRSEISWMREKDGLRHRCETRYRVKEMLVPKNHQSIHEI
jgi:hypothetical protein